MTTTLPFSNIKGQLPDNEMEQIIQKLIVNRSGDIEKIEELLTLKTEVDSITSNAFLPSILGIQTNRNFRSAD